MNTKDAPHGRGMAWATLLVSGGISLGVNLWHAFDQAHGNVTWWFASLAIMYGTAPVVLAAFQSHSAAFVPMGWFRLGLTYVLMVLGMALSIRAQAAAVEPFAGKGWRWVFPIVVDLSAIQALITLMLTARARARAEDAADRPRSKLFTEPGTVGSAVICRGRDGLFQIRVPELVPSPEVQANRLQWEDRLLAGPAGTQVNLDQVRRGSHPPVVYFIRNGNRIKIGTTTNLGSRVAALCLRLSDVVQVLHGGPIREQMMHEQFAAFRDGDSEWFELAGELASFLGAREPEPVRVEHEPARVRPAVVPVPVAKQRNRKADQVREVLKLIAARGYEAVTLAVVREELGLSKTTAFHRLRDAREEWNRAGTRTGTDGG